MPETTTKALIIGSAGFVGGYLIDELLNNRGMDVVATKLPTEQIVGHACKVVDLDILDKDAITEVLEAERPDQIYHLAAQSSVAVSWAKPQLTVDINIKGSLNLLEAARSLDYKPRLLLIGSGEEYGEVREGDCPIKETLPPNPQNIYAITKATQNQIGTLYARAYGLDVIMTRAFNHIGIGQTDTFVVPGFCKQVAQVKRGEHEPVIKVGNLAAKRDFSDVRDIVRAYALLAEYGQAGETYNIGSGKAVTIQEVLHTIIIKTTIEIMVEIDKNRFRPIDVPIIEADISKLQAATGWRPEIPLEQTISEVFESVLREVP